MRKTIKKQQEREKVWYRQNMNYPGSTVITESDAKMQIKTFHMKYLGGETWVNDLGTFMVFAKEREIKNGKSKKR